MKRFFAKEVLMSFVVLAIAAAYTLPPILGATMGNSKSGLWIGVAIGVLVSLISGNPAFVVMDLIGVALGTWVGLSLFEKQPHQ